MNRKLWSTEEKATIVLEILHGDETAAAICQHYRVVGLETLFQARNMAITRLTELKAIANIG